MTRDMTRGRVGGQIFLFTLPIMAGNFLQQLYNTVDGIVVGNYIDSPYALAAVGTCASLTMVYIALAIGLGIGCGVLVSQLFGAGDKVGVRKAVATALFLMTGVGLLLTVVGVTCSGPLLRWVLAVDENALPLARLYLSVYSIGLVFQFIYNAAAALLRAVGDSRAMLLFLLVSSVLNIALDFLFVLGFHRGVGGIAAATVLSQLVSAVIAMIYLLRGPLAPRREEWRFDRGMCRTMAKLSVPAIFQHLAVSLGNVALQRLVNAFGTVSMEGYTAASRLLNFVFVPVMGFNAGMSSFTGQNIGAERLDRVYKGFRHTLFMTLIATGALVAVIYIFSTPLVALFGCTGEALARGVMQMRFLAPFFLLFSVHMVCSGLLQGSGDVTVASAATICALLVRILVGYGMFWFTDIGYSLIWKCIPFSWCMSLAITLPRFLSGRWKTKSVVRRQPPKP